MENLYCALNHTGAINLIHYVKYRERWNPPPPFFFVVAKMNIILDKIKALKLGK